MKRPSLHRSAFMILFCLCGLAPLRQNHADDRPNFVVIFIDDLGFSDIQPFSDRHATPNLARMAKEGRTFSSFYVAASVCTPSSTTGRPTSQHT